MPIETFITVSICFASKNSQKMQDVIESCNSIEIQLYSNLYSQSVLPNLYMTYVNKLFIWHDKFAYDTYLVCDRFQELFGFWFTWINSHLQKEVEKKSRPTAQLRRTELSVQATHELQPHAWPHVWKWGQILSHAYLHKWHSIYIRGFTKFGIKVLWRLKFLEYLRTLSLKCQ